MWRATGHRMRRIAATGLLPQGGFGASITGLSDEDLDAMRRIAEMATGGRSRGRSMKRRRLVDGDQAEEWAAAPVLEWAKEVRAARRRDLGACTWSELATFWDRCRRRAVSRWSEA